MRILAIIVVIYFFIKTFFYGLYELKENNNKSGGIYTIVISIIALVFPIVEIWLQ